MALGTKEAHLPKPTLRSVRVTAPILLAFGAVNAWTTQAAADYTSLSTARCLCVCAAGLFGEDLLQRGYRQDLTVLAYVAAHPGAVTRGIARAVGIPVRLAARNLSRLTEGGFLILVADDGCPVPRSYRLAA